MNVHDFFNYPFLTKNFGHNVQNQYFITEIKL